MSNLFGRLAMLPLGCCVLVLAALFAAAAVGEDAKARADRYDNLIESLNATSERRARVLEVIYAELRGPNIRDMQEVLRTSLSRDNTLILQGVVEALAMLGDASDVPALEALLATNHRLEVKTLVIRLLPSFTISGSERARFNYINYATGYERIADASVLEPLRRPPLTRRGRLDPARERLQNRVVRALARQFDPVGAALAYAEDRVYGSAARNAVIYYTGVGLGNDPVRWQGIWDAQGAGMLLREAAEIEEIRLTALQTLSDMGAEGLPELLAALERLHRAGGEILPQAAFEAMAVMCRSGFDSFRDIALMQFGAEDQVEAESWRRRRLASTANLALFSAESAGTSLARADGVTGFEAAAACLGAALSFPDSFPDPDHELAAARQRGLSLLERLLMMPDIRREQRAAVGRALGEIGSERAVNALVSIVESPYCSPEFGADGMAMAEAAVDALRGIAVGGHDGRDTAREALLRLLADTRMFPPVRPGTPPVGLAHMVLWRLQRLAKSNETSLEQDSWRRRLGW